MGRSKDEVLRDAAVPPARRNGGGDGYARGGSPALAAGAGASRSPLRQDGGARAPVSSSLLSGKELLFSDHSPPPRDRSRDSPTGVEAPRILSESPSGGGLPKTGNKIHQRPVPGTPGLSRNASEMSMPNVTDRQHYLYEGPYSARGPGLQLQDLQDAHVQLCEEIRSAFREELNAALSRWSTMVSGPPAPPLEGGRKRQANGRTGSRASPASGLEDHVDAFEGELVADGRTVDGVADPVDKNSVDKVVSTQELAEAAVTLNVKTADTPATMQSTIQSQQKISQEIYAAVEDEDHVRPPAIHNESASDRIKRVVPVMAPLVNLVMRVHRWLAGLQEPERTGCLSRFIKSQHFEILTLFGIALNCAFMVYSADYEVSNYQDDKKPEFYKTAELFFLVWFVLEWGVKVAVHKSYFFFASTWKMRLLDTFLIMLHTWSVLGNYGVAASTQNWSFMRAIRMLRLLRVVRALRAMNHFKQLHALLAAINNSMMTLMWSMLMVCGILWMFSLLFVQRVASYFNAEYADNGGVDPAVLESLEPKFGSVWTSMVGLFMATTGGDDWSIYYRALTPTGFLNQAIYLCFVAFMQVAVLNIVTGIFVDCALKQMEKDAEEEAMEYLNTEHRREQELLALCNEADKDHSGQISYDELLGAFDRGKMNMYLDHIGFQHQDVLDFFKIMAGNSDDSKVDVEVFVKGCMRLRGVATRFDMKAVQMELKLIHHLVGELRTMSPSPAKRLK